MFNTKQKEKSNKTQPIFFLIYVSFFLIFLIDLCFSTALVQAHNHEIRNRPNGYDHPSQNDAIKNLNLGLVLQPAVTELEVDKGQTYTIDYTIENNSNSPEITIESSIMTFSSSAEGVPVVRDFEANQPQRKWMSLPTTSFNLIQSQPRKITASLKIPSNADSGSYYYAVLFKKSTLKVPSTTPKIIAEQAIAPIVFVKVKGPIQREVKIEKFQATNAIVDPFFDNIEITYDVNIRGDNYLRPTGVITFGDSNDNKSNLTLNPEKKIVLGNSSRAFNMRVNPNTPFVLGIRDSNSKNEQFLVNSPWFGPQKVTATVIYSNSGTIMHKTEVDTQLFYFPWKTLLAIIFVLVLPFSILFLARILLHKIALNLE
ncbi:MAG: hypothetical protein OHK0017_00370 [Patescibacteria group bacterium]